jgi:putative Holliday junction resolvase
MRAQCDWWLCLLALVRCRGLNPVGSHHAYRTPGPFARTAYNCAVTHENQPGRVLALDVGSRTIGLAVSDPLGVTAQGLPTIRRKNKRTDFEALERVLETNSVRELVVGNPLRMSGAAGVQAEKMALFADELRKRFQVPVHLWDERLTSAEANRVLRETDMSIRRRAEVVDRLAAVLILQSFMEARSNRL